MDKKSYYKLFSETDYNYENSQNVRYPDHPKPLRSICIDINKAIQAVIDLDGFRVDRSTTLRTTNRLLQLSV